MKYEDIKVGMKVKIACLKDMANMGKDSIRKSKKTIGKIFNVLRIDNERLITIDCDERKYFPRWRPNELEPVAQTLKDLIK